MSSDTAAKIAKLGLKREYCFFAYIPSRKRIMSSSSFCFVVCSRHRWFTMVRAPFIAPVT